MDCQNNLAEPRSGYSCEVIMAPFIDGLGLIQTFSWSHVVIDDLVWEKIVSLCYLSAMVTCLRCTHTRQTGRTITFSNIHSQTEIRGQVFQNQTTTKNSLDFTPYHSGQVPHIVQWYSYTVKSFVTKLNMNIYSIYIYLKVKSRSCFVTHKWNMIGQFLD